MARVGTRCLVGACALVSVVLLAGCRPEVSFDLDGRQSKIDEVDVQADVLANGVVQVQQRYTFEDDDGGTVALPYDVVDPSLPVGVLAAVRNVTVDDEPADVSEGTFEPQVRVTGEHATVAYEVVGAVKRYADIADLQLDVLPAPEDNSRQDPDVDLHGTLRVPAGAAGTVQAHLHNGRERRVSVDGPVVTFSDVAPIWRPDHELAVAFPAAAVPELAQQPISGLPQFEARERARDATDESTESVLSDVDAQEDLSRWIITAVAFGLPAIFWLIVLKGFLGRLRERRAVVRDVPDELSDPPTKLDPGVVAVLEGEGRPDKEAVAGTILAMAHRKVVDVQEYGDKVVVKVPLATTAENGSEQQVLDALRREATPEGVVEGPPLWRHGDRWFRGYRRDAVQRARDAGLAVKWLPLAPLSGALITTGIGFSLFFFTQPWIYFTIVFGVQIVGYVISFVSGYTLTPSGWRNRALWRSFGRYIHRQSRIDKDVGPAGVVVWGPYLVYGSVLGEAHAAARPLTP